MVYFNLNLVTDPPNDELVNVNTQLNLNWEEIANKLDPFQKMPTTLVNPPKGTEAYYPLGSVASEHERIAVYNGSVWHRCLNQTAGITTWQGINIQSPVTPRLNYPPVARVDVYHRRVELAGALTYNNANQAFPTTIIEVTTPAAISPDIAPIGGSSVHEVAAGASASISAAVVSVDLLSSPTRVAIRVKHQGNSPVGGYINLDQVGWWF